MTTTQLKGRIEEKNQRVLEALSVHASQIVNTLASLIRNELNGTMGALDKDVDWDKKGTEDLDMAQKYMKDFIEKLNKLYQVLSLQLNREDINTVFERVIVIIGQRVPELFQVVKPKTPAGKTRVRVDIINLLSTLRRLNSQSQKEIDALEKWMEERYGRDATE